MSKDSIGALMQSAEWRVKATIDKFDTPNSYDLYKTGKVKKAPDERLISYNNKLLEGGTNLLWSLVAGYITDGGKNEVPGLEATPANWRPFSDRNSFIGVSAGSSMSTDGTPTPDLVTPDSVAGDSFFHNSMFYLFAPMSQYPEDSDVIYPRTGISRKIVFRSIFPPGTANFTWEEWGIANGNANKMDQLQYSRIFITEENASQLSAADQTFALQNPLPNAKIFFNNDGAGSDPTYPPGPGMGMDNNPQGPQTDPQKNCFVMLNCRQEQMGEKKPPSTWIITCEISLQ